MDVKVKVGKDLFVLAENNPYINFFKLKDFNTVEFHKRISYGFNCTLTGQIKPKEKFKALIFETTKPVIIILDENDVYYAEVNEFYN